MYLYKSKEKIPELRRKAGELVRLWSRSLVSGGGMSLIDTSP